MQSSNQTSKQEKPFQFNDGMFLPIESLKFYSCKIVHMMHCGIALQIITTQHMPPTHLFQQASRSTTCLGITQETPKRLNTNIHKLYA